MYVEPLPFHFVSRGKGREAFVMISSKMELAALPSCSHICSTLQDFRNVASFEAVGISHPSRTQYMSLA